LPKELDDCVVLAKLATFMNNVMAIFVVNLLCGLPTLESYVRLCTRVTAGSSYLFHQWDVDFFLLPKLFRRRHILAIFGQIALGVQTIGMVLSRLVCIGLAACPFPLLSYLSSRVSAAT
jgi:hypothetical protein